MRPRGPFCDHRYLPMQKVQTRPDPSIYADSSDLASSWRLAGDLNSPVTL